MLKKGISAVVATVLIILITVAGVSLVWISILPMLQEPGSEISSDLNLDVVLEGYTVYDPAVNFAFVQVERGADDVGVVALEIIFYFNGSSYSYLREDVPLANEKKTYAFNFTRDGLKGIPEKVSIAPVMKIGDTEKIGKIVSDKLIPVSKIDLEEEEWEEAEEDSKVSVRIYRSNGGFKKCKDGKDFIDGACYIPLVECNEIEEQGDYYLKNNIESDGICFNITSDDVVLNLNNKIMRGSGSSWGIKVFNQNNIEIKNGVITNFSIGIGTLGSNNLVLLDLNTSYNLGNSGISIDGGRSHLIRNIVSNFNGDSGMKLIDVEGLELIDVMANYNGYAGIRFRGLNSSFNGINVSYTASRFGPGFKISGGSLISNFNNFSNVFAIFNGRSGIYVEGDLNNSIFNNVEVSSNSRNGFEMGSSSSLDNLIINNKFNDITSCGNDGKGFFCREGVSDNLLGGVNRIEDVENCVWISEDDYSSCD